MSRRRPPFGRFALLLSALALARAFAPAPARALDVATWNLIDYPNTNLAGRQPHIRTVIAALDPDLIVLQELKSQAGRDSFLINVLNVVHPGEWAATSFLSTTESAAFYRPARVHLAFADAVPVDLNPGPRDALRARFEFPGYTSRLAEFEIYSIHFKAGTPMPGTPDSTTRRQEASVLRTHLNNRNLAVLTPHVLVAGDYNIYGDWEGAYQRLTESQADNDGRLFDFFSLPGTWNQFAYRGHHTQSTCNTGTCPSGWSTGGLDDRFDFFLSTTTVQDGEGLDYVPGSWHYFGNDAQHMNQPVDGGGFNNEVGLAVATALRLSSDHLPVILTLQAPAKVAAESQIDFGRVLVGATAQRTLNVSNPATVPADELTYTLTPPAGISAPAGTFNKNAGVAPNPHTLGMDTAAPGARNGVLTIASDDPDSSSRPVQISGAVLAHAVPSLDAGGIARDAILDFGNHAPGGFTDQQACAHNLGWNTFQAEYAISAATITGGAGRFSIVGGFTPVEVADTPACLPIRFDDAGATLDSTYVATLTLTGADEALPGGAPAPALTVTLRAHTGTTVGAPEAPRIERIAFRAPRPNPTRGAVELGFELPHAARVDLDLFDLGGRRVAAIASGVHAAGRHLVRWSPLGARVEPGLYFVSFRTSGLVATRRLVLLP